MSSEKRLFLERVSEVFRDVGYQIDAPGTIRGLSGQRHEVDLLCRRGTDVILVGVEKDDDSVGVAPVISLYAKAKDANAKAVLIAIPDACPLARTLSEQYHLPLCEARNPLQAASFIKKVLKDSTGSALPVSCNALPSLSGRKLSYRDPNTYARRTRLKTVKSAIELLILQTGDQTSITGYDVISLVHSKFGILLSPGTVYPVLRRLEEQGLVNPAETAHKRSYSTTPLGRSVGDLSLEEWREINSEILNHLNSIRSLEGALAPGSHGPGKSGLDARRVAA
jgi:DNA-binding PadR family transcriptional regulator